MNILGIDPGYAETGFALLKKDTSDLMLKKAGVISTKNGGGEFKRLKKIKQEIFSLLEETNPDVVVMESLPKIRGNRIIQIARASGIIISELLLFECEIHEISPTEIKKCLTGNGNATKKELSDYVMEVLGLKERLQPHHVSDAAACVIAYLWKKERIREE